MPELSNEGGIAGDTPLQFEQLRLLDLRSLNLLDSDSEERFDRLTGLLADALEVPIALVSLVDERRQWFKSSCGLDLRETSRETSFCAYALREPELLIIPDATRDPRFSANPLVLGPPYIRFYAGALLRGPAGMPIGTCCIIDRKPRELDERERKILRQVALLVEREMHQTENLAAVRREIEREVYRDAATGVGNDRLFREQLRMALDTARENQQQVTAVAIQLANLAEAKAAGMAEDDLLAAATERLLPLCSGPGALLARRGGHLAALLNGTPRDQGLMVERMATVLAPPLDTGTVRLDFGAVLGVATYPDHGNTAESLIDAAEAALTMRPVGGVGPIRYHDAALAGAMSARQILRHRLRAAIRRDELNVVYQPKIDASSDRYVGAEALVRWTDPQHGPVSPLDMITAAEGSDLIHELGHWVLRAVARQVRDWRRAGLSGLCPVAVNLSAAELLHPQLCQRVRAVLAEFEIAPGAIQIEVTESTLVEDIAAAAERIGELRGLGLSFAIDDFGTGYSSLAYLQRLPVDVLKVDRSFVRDMAEDPDAAAMVQGIIALAHGLRLKVVAEGVETDAQAARLRALGCDQLQGYFYSRPASAEGLQRWVVLRVAGANGSSSEHLLMGPIGRDAQAASAGAVLRVF